MLYHISEDSGISRFEPRPGQNSESPVVWAITPARLRNYLLPRDCPRVTFFADERTTVADRDRLLGQADAVVAFQGDWLDRIRRTRLFCYRLPEQGFSCVDRCAGYFQSTTAVVPEGVDVVDDCLSALVSHGVEVRIVPTLWPIYDAVTASTVGYSIIRMRNAAPRTSG